MITDYFMITEKSNRLQVIMITDYDYPISAAKFPDSSHFKHLWAKNIELVPPKGIQHKWFLEFIFPHISHW